MNETEKTAEKVQDGVKINETFLSMQGEGQQIGMISWFIRTSGCDLSCKWCDSKYANDGKYMDIESVTAPILKSNCKNVIITGGEPFIQKNLLQLIKALGDCHIYVETNGTIFDSNLLGYAQYTVSPKLQFLNTKYMESLQRWATRASFKFVIGSKADFDRAVTLAKTLHLETSLKPTYFMPMGTDADTINDIMISLVTWCKDVPWIRISPRLQIQLYGDKRGV